MLPSAPLRSPPSRQLIQSTLTLQVIIIGSIVIFAAVAVAAALLLRELALPHVVGDRWVEVGEDQVKYVGEPLRRAPFDALFDVLLCTRVSFGPAFVF
jgi:hypothetical protein